MPTLAFAGGEIGTMAELATPSGIGMETAIVHAGKYAYRVSAAGTGTLAFTPSTLLYFRGYFLYPSGLAANSTILDVKTSGAVSLFTIRIVQATGLLQTTLNAVTFNSSTLTRPDVWHRLELRVDQVAGTVELRLDGRSEFMATGPIATPPGQIAITSTSGTTYWDDLHLTTEGWVGPGHVMARQGKPGTPTYTAFTKTGGAIEVVWSETPSGAVNFAASTAVSQTQTMVVESVGGVARGGKYGTLRVRGNDTVLGAQVLCIAKRDAGVRDLFISRIVNGELTNVQIPVATTDALYSSGIFTVYPDAVDGAVGYAAMEIGAARGQGASNITVEDVWLMLAVATGEYSRVHLTGLETGSILEVGATAGTVAVSSARAKTGTYALSLTGPAASASLIPGTVDVLDHPRLYLRAWLSLPVLPAAEEAVLSLRGAQGIMVECRIAPSGAARLYVRGVQQGADVAGAFVAGTGWTCVEIFSRAPVTGADGAAGMRINGGSEVLFAGDTGWALTQAVVGVLTNVGLVLYADDITIADIGWIGPGRIVARQGIAGTPGSNAWTKVGGSIEAVWSNTPTNSVTYAESPAISTAQEMQVAPAGLAATDIVLAVRIAAFCKLVSAGVGGPHRLRRRSGSTTRNQAIPLASTTTALFLGDAFTLTPANLTALQIGGSIGQEAPQMRIEDLWLMIEYASLTLAPLPSLPSVPPAVSGLLLELDL